MDVRYSSIAAMARRFESLTLKMKIKDVEDFDENWQAMVSGQCICVQKLALLGTAFVRSTIMIWLKIGRHTKLVHIHMYEYFAAYTVQLRRNGVKSTTIQSKE